MNKTDETATLRVWRFVCPECGFGDEELAGPAAVEEIHCEVCLDEHGRRVILRRWVSEKPGMVG